jgi:hypothetical protein
MRIFASRTIISAGSALSATTQFFEVGDELFFVHVGERCGETVGCGPEFRKFGCFQALSPGRNVNAQGFTAPRDGNRGIRFSRKLGCARGTRAHRL